METKTCHYPYKKKIQHFLNRILTTKLDYVV